MSFEKRSSNGVALKIAEELRALVVNGTFIPGSRLIQLELAQRFESSPVPVREALKLLTSEGIVEYDLNRGFFVAGLSSVEARQLFRLRHFVEDEVIRSVEWPDTNKISQLRKYAFDMESYIIVRNRKLWSEQYRTLHKVIFDLSPNKIMVREAMRLWNMVERFNAILPLPNRSVLGNNVGKDELVEAIAERNHEKLINVRHARRAWVERTLLEMLTERRL